MNKFKVAFLGLLETLHHQSVLIQIVMMIIALCGSIMLGFDSTELIVVVLCCGLVIVTEIINTCIEKICDFMTTKQDDRIKRIKDMSAGAVLFASLLSLAIGIGLLINHLGG